MANDALRGYPKGEGIHADFVHFASIGEGSHGDAMDFLANRLPVRDAIYFGVAGMLNLSYIARLRPRKARLIDVNPLQTLFWQVTIDKLAGCEELPDFLTSIERSEAEVAARAREAFRGATLVRAGAMSETFGYVAGPLLKKDRGTYRGESVVTWLGRQNRADQAWRNPESYKFLHQLALAGDMDAVTLDLLNKHDCQRLSGDFVVADASTVVVYASNIRLFLFGNEDFTGRKGVPANDETFWENISALAGGRASYVVEGGEIHTLPARRPAPQQVLVF